MNQKEMIHFCNLLDIKEIVFDSQGWSDYLFDEIIYRNENIPEEEFKYLEWNRIEGFILCNGLEEYKKFKWSENFHDDVNYVDANYDSETDCVIFGISCWCDSDTYQTVCGVVPVKFLEEHGIKIIKETWNVQKDSSRII